MKRLLLLSLLLAAPVFAAEPAPRRVEITVTADGYKPEKVAAKPGEKLILVFKGTADMGCCDSIVVAASNWKGKVGNGKTVEVPVTVPASGAVTFACSMNMCKGSVGK
jgi:plastocyanin domain-containing protein